MLWSANPSTEAIWREMGVGPVDGRHLALGCDQSGRKQARPVPHSWLHLPSTTPRESNRWDADGHSHERHPLGQVNYIAGPYPGLDTVYGEYVGIVTVNLPDAVRDLSLGPGELAVVDGPEGPTLVVGVDVDLLVGATNKSAFISRFPAPTGR